MRRWWCGHRHPSRTIRKRIQLRVITWKKETANMYFILNRSSFNLWNPMNQVAVDNNNHSLFFFAHESSEYLLKYNCFKAILQHHEDQLFDQLPCSLARPNIKRQFQPIQAMVHNTLRHLWLQPMKKASASCASLHLFFQSLTVSVTLSLRLFSNLLTIYNKCLSHLHLLPAIQYSLHHLRLRSF